MVWTTISKINRYVSIVSRDGKEYVAKRISESNHPFLACGIEIKDPVARSVYFAKLFDDLGVGPRVIEVIDLVSDNIIITEKVRPITQDDIDDPQTLEKIQKAIKKLHLKGIVHGDLHGGNIAISPTGSVVFLDTDTAFWMDEYNTKNFAREWVHRNFSDLQQFIDYEENESFRVVGPE